MHFAAKFFVGTNITTFPDGTATDNTANNWSLYQDYGLDAVAQLFVTSWEVEAPPHRLWIRLKDRNNPDNVITLRASQKVYPFGQRND